MKVAEIVEKQRQFYATHQTKDLNFRLQMLGKLQEQINAHEKELVKALSLDLQKSEFEAYETEIGLVLEEIKIHQRKLKKWSKPVRVKTPWFHFAARSKVISEPYGNVLVMAPWNYPFQLLMAPLVGAISAGNCVLLKPSDISPYTAEVIKKITDDAFDPQYIATVLGEREVIQEVLAERYDYIFFTGGSFLGNIVMQSAAKNLTPVTLELGGKSPCIVEKDADLDVAAKRIVWGKFLNAGQTCVAPDYLLVHEDVKEQLLTKMTAVIEKFFGENPQQSVDYPRIVNDKHFARLAALITPNELYYGGQTEAKEKYISPTILDNITDEHPIMQDEIFGPILPVQTYKNLDEAIAKVNSRPKPLAQYFFSESKKKRNQVLLQTSFGGGCINDTVLHLSNPNMPFGGVGSSGMGGYHGKASYDTLSHKKSVLRSSTCFDIPFRYPPYKGKIALVKKIMG